MSLTRSISLFKSLKNSSYITTARHGHGPSHVYYRKNGLEDVPQWAKNGRDFLIGFTTWWILWHCWHEPGHIVGDFEYPDPSKWSDAELGIPPDDED